MSGSNPGAITVENCSTVTIERCTFAGDIGKAIYALNTSNVTIRDCAFSDIRSDGIGNFVQFDKCTGTHVVEDCWGVNHPLRCDVEDIVSIFRTPNVTVQRCVFFGGGPSSSGSGILVGDGAVPGDNATIIDNVLINTGQVGIGVAGGDGHTIEGNTIHNSGTPESNVGLYVWDGGDGSTIGDVALINNEVLWIKADRSENPTFKPHGTKTESGNNYSAQGQQAEALFDPTGYHGYP